MAIVREASANGVGELILDKVLDKELGDKCALYAKVTLTKGATLAFHKHFGEGESYLILSGEAIYDDNGVKRVVKAGDRTWTPSGTGHGLDNSQGAEDLVFMALIVKA